MKKGVTLLLVMLVLSAILSISIGIFTLVYGELKISGEISDSFVAFYASDSGLEKLSYETVAHNNLCSDPDPEGCARYDIPDTITYPNTNACITLLRVNRAGQAITLASVANYNRQGCSVNQPIGVVRSSSSFFTKSNPGGSTTLLGFWPFNDCQDDTITEATGKGTNGVRHTDAVWESAGHNFCAMRFNGTTNSYAYIPGGGGLAGLRQGTIAMWVKWEGLQQSSATAGVYGAVLGRQFDGLYSNDIIGLDDSDPSKAHVTWQPFSAGSPATWGIVGRKIVGDGNWHSVVITFAPNDEKLYVDGFQDGANTSVNEVLNSDIFAPLTIGAWGGDGNSNAKAVVDELKIFANALTPEEVKLLP